MLDELNDPNPPRPPAGALEAVHRRARTIRRRRAVVRAVPLALFGGLVLAAGLALAVDGDGGESVELIDRPPEEQPELLEDRGEVFRATILPEGAELESQRMERRDEGFSRSVRWETPDGDGISVLREEGRASELDALFGVPSETSPGGRAWSPAPDSREETVVWRVEPTIAIRVHVEGGDLADAEAVLDGLVYEPPDPRCVNGEVVSEAPACEPIQLVDE